MRLAAATALVSLALLAVDTEADAAPRYASPGGGGTACSKAEPCSLELAVSEANTGDEVIVGAGTYKVDAPLHVEPGITALDIHGDESAPIPQLVSTKAVVVIDPPRESRLAYLEVLNSGADRSGVVCIPGSRVERVHSMVTGQAAIAIKAEDDCAVRDSVARADGEGAVGLYATSVPSTEGAFTAVARNVTGIATGKASKGIVSDHQGGPPPGGSETLDARNVIAEGGEADLATSLLGAGAALIRVSNSNFDTVSSPEAGSFADLGGNQTAPPLFVNAAAGDYREAAGSPTIDAGVADQLGPLDFAGNPRVLGTAPDIGAFEFVPSVPGPVPGQIQSLAIVPKAFRPVNAGEAIISATKRGVPVGTTVTYSLSADAATYFFAERKTVGRRVGGKCAKPTKANRAKKKCPLYKQVRGSFASSGRSGLNSFRFSGRIGGRGLKPGSYRLVASTSAARITAPFKIVR